MLKKRIAASLVVKDGIVVQSINFKKYLPVGKPAIAMEYLNLWGIDEIILADISATRNKRPPDFELIRRATDKCYVPLTVGGGITHNDHIKELMHCGADKISLNQSAIHRPKLITEGAAVFGTQCIVISIDVVKENGKYRVYDYLNKKALDISPDEFAKRAEDMGAGEIYVNSVDRDGSYTGYDLDMIKMVCDVVKVPVICCGGAKNAYDFIRVFEATEVSAASAANFFHFTEHSVNTTKANISKLMSIRREAYADYKDSDFDEELRLLKKSDEELEQMLFVRIMKEVI